MLSTLLALGHLAHATANLDLVTRGDVGVLTGKVKASLTCMDLSTRRVETFNGEVGPQGWIGVLANVNEVRVVDTQIPMGAFDPAVTSFTSPQLDDGTRVCRLDIAGRSVESLTMNSGLAKSRR